MRCAVDAPRGVCGVTLVELMVVVVIVAIGGALAMPSFTQLIRSNRLASGVNETLAAFNLARSEALRNNRGAGICPSTAGASCNGTDWNAGVLAYADNDRSGAFSVGDIALRYVQPRAALVVEAIVGAGETGAGSNGTTSQIAINGRGRVRVATDIVIRAEGCEAGQELQRRVSVSRVGQTRTQREACE